MKRIITLIGILAFIGFQVSAQQLRISDDKRHIIYRDGKPFFWLGDTAWELFHRLTREEADLYLENRAKKGFNVIQAVVLAELNGLQDPNAYGQTPFIGIDPSKLNEEYFQHVDYIVNKANELGMFVGMLPTWGDKFNRMWGVGPVVFNANNAYEYGKFLGKRYMNSKIVWILGGDRNPTGEGHMQIIRAMAKGIREEVGKTQLFTYHPTGGSNSAMWFHNDDWLDLNMFQSGHGENNNQNYKITNRIYNLPTTKPVLDGEPCYEDHPINWKAENGWFDEFESRRAGWWSMLAGACGHTYGNHNVWQMWQTGRDPISVARTPWQQAIDYPGASQAGYMRSFFEALDWQKLEPKWEIIKNGPNTGGKEILASVAKDSSFLLAYIPYGNEISIDLSVLSSDILTGNWYNPRNNNYIDLGVIKKSDNISFNPPADPMRGNDWVLVVKSGN
ncbi:MAG: glycoside hydrolase family 140 protein [Cyclobacteriaceae bacterium]|nr:glycoside hydrolase family 140 protein [Cyclobacteriaceae bacterium]